MQENVLTNLKDLVAMAFSSCLIQINADLDSCVHMSPADINTNPGLSCLLLLN